jgi:undecaprenyl-diphosphatase
VVGIALLVTSFLLYLSGVLKPKEKGITFRNALIIGVAQSVAVIPGLSRSGATISTGLLLGARREDIAKFSFLMVLVPILGEAFLELVSGGFASESTGIGVLPLAAGFLAAFTSGLFACKAMIALVKKTKLKGFALYCAILGVIAIIYSYV